MRLNAARSISTLLALVFLASCTETGPTSSDEAAPAELSAPANRENAAQPWATFYPLAIGNRWRSTRAWSGTWIGDGEPPWPAESGTEDYEFEQICTEVRGVAYIVEEQRIYSDGDSGASHVRYRQNGAGLYEADVCLCEPPDCSTPSLMPPVVRRTVPYDRFWQRIATTIPDPEAQAVVKESWDRFCSKIEAARRLSIPSGVEKAAGAPELIRLKYPLFPGQNWAIRNDPSFVFKAAVETFEFIALPIGRAPAYRVRVSPPIDPAEVFDYVQWWGPCGFLGDRMHSEFEWTDGAGKLVFVFDASQEVTEVDLVDRRACTISEE